MVARTNVVANVQGVAVFGPPTRRTRVDEDNTLSLHRFHRRVDQISTASGILHHSPFFSPDQVSVG